MDENILLRIRLVIEDAFFGAVTVGLGAGCIFHDGLILIGVTIWVPNEIVF